MTNTWESIKVKHNADIIVYTDGGCRNHGNIKNGHVKNTDVAAWAFAIYKSKLFSKAGSKCGYTNNQMELGAVVNALAMLDKFQMHQQKIVVIMDSKYVLDGLNKWMSGWVKRNWKTANQKPVKNQDLWKILLALKAKFTNIEFVWTKGHANDDGNNLVDKLLNDAMDNQQAQIAKTINA